MLDEVRVLSHVEVLRLYLNVLLLYHVHSLLLLLMEYSHLLVKHKLFISVNCNHLLLPESKVHLALNLTCNRSLYQLLVTMLNYTPYRVHSLVIILTDRLVVLVLYSKLDQLLLIAQLFFYATVIAVE